MKKTMGERCRQYDDVRPVAGAVIRWRNGCFVLSGYRESFVRKFWFLSREKKMKRVGVRLRTKERSEIVCVLRPGQGKGREQAGRLALSPSPSAIG